MSTKREDVFVGVASIPSREASLKQVVDRLLPQARHIGVYLNGYDKVPLFLRRNRIVVARSQDHGDLRDNGKFFFVDKSDARYYAAVDDDLVYPRDYLPHLVTSLNELEQKSAIGVHGAIYPSPVVELFDPRVLLHFEDPSPHVMPVHLLGTGTVLFDQSQWRLEPGEFGQPGMADVWFAAAAARRDAALFVARRVRNWITAVDRNQEGRRGGALFFEGLLDSTHQVSVLRQSAPSTHAFEGLLESLFAGGRLAEDVSLHQALELDSIRTQLGYAPPSDRSIAGADDLLDKRATGWAVEHPVSAEEARSFGRLVLDILIDQVSASSVEPVLELLDRLRTLAIADPVGWGTLPWALRYDSSPERAGRLATSLLERGARRSADDSLRLWNAFEGKVGLSITAALRLERAGVRTGFERLPDLIELARENPEAAAARVYDYYETIGWSREPDLAGLRMAFGDEYESLDVQMLVCVAAARAGNADFARRMLRRLRRRWPWDRDVRLLEASLTARDTGSPVGVMQPTIEIVDQILTAQGLTRYADLMHNGGDDGHWIHSLGGETGTRSTETRSEPTVSVLMTTYNDASTVGAAMNSILASVGVPFELIVVDDASSDASLEQIEAVDDPRVTVVRNEENVGPYLSRNRALERARGRYVAIADADDWSHPQRLAYQSSILDESPSLVACKVAHLRLRPDGTLDLENHLRFVGDGPVSLMFRRWLVDHVGGFDHVRTRGDIEFLRRITARFGEGALASFETPLILATSSATSNSKRFHEESLNIYRAAARRWHEQRALSDALYVPLAGERAPFMAPYELLAKRSIQN